jgi:hypothetical protein
MIPKRQPTAEEVLAILVDQYRHQSQIDPESEPGMTLTFDSSIADWRVACDLLDWRRLALALNAEWGLSLSLAEWRGLLEPAKERRLRAMCETISSRAQIESMPEFGYLGCRNVEGRALRSLRAVLLVLGMPREEIRTTTPVAPLITKYGWRLLSPCLRFAPGALPSIKHVGRTHRILVIAMASFTLVGVVLAAVHLPFGGLSLCLALVCLLLLWIPHPIFRGSLVVPGIDTLADLATCLAKRVRATKGQ